MNLKTLAYDLSGLDLFGCGDASVTGSWSVIKLHERLNLIKVPFLLSSYTCSCLNFDDSFTCTGLG